MKTTRVTDLTIEELIEILRPLIHDTVREAISETAHAPMPLPQRPPLDLPVVNVGPWPEGLSLRREEVC